MTPQPALAPPRILNRWQVWAALALLVLAPFLVPIPTGLRRHPLIGQLGDLVHIPLLAVVTLLFYWKGPLRGRLLSAGAAAAVLGAAVEVMQLLVGRAALVSDFVMDLVGIGTVLGLVLWRGHGRRAGLLLILLLLLHTGYGMREIPAKFGAREFYRRMSPVLEDCEGRHFHRMWTHTGTAEIGFPPIEDGPSGSTFVLRIIGVPAAAAQGASMMHFPYDWRAYRFLEFEARCVWPESGAVFAVELEDFPGPRPDVVVRERYVAGSAWQTYRFPLQNRTAGGGGRRLDLGDMERLRIVFPSLRDSSVIQLDDLRLVE